jgi:antitoxin MazE
MQTVVQKWGNSLGIRIPNLYVKEFDLKNGCAVDIIEEEGRLIIKPKKFTLDFLLDQINEDSLQEKIETGPSVGNEEW